MTSDRRVSEASALRAFFQEQLQYLGRLIGAGDGDTLPGVSGSPNMGEAVDMVVQGTDERVRAVSSYKKRLRTGTRALLEHIDGLVNRMPEALHLSRESFVYDPQVSAYFSGMDQIEKLCQQNSEVDEYISSSATSGDASFFALLFLNYIERDIFTTELQGDILQRDVRRTGVVFAGHKFRSPAGSDAEIRQSLKRILFDNVVEHIKGLLGRRRMADADRKSGGATLPSGEGDLNNPIVYLASLVKLLELPLDLIRLHENMVRINRMGIKLPDTTEPKGDEIRLQQLEIGADTTSLILLTKISLASVP